MKKLFKIASVAMFFVQSAMAQDMPEVQNSDIIATPTYFAKFMSRDNAFKMSILLAKRDGDDSVLRIRIIDKDGHWLYTNYVNKKQSQAKVDFNLEELPDGKYTFELSNKHGKTLKTYIKGTEKEYIKYTKQLIAIN